MQSLSNHTIIMLFFFLIDTCFTNRIITSNVSILSNSITYRKLLYLNKVLSYIHLQQTLELPTLGKSIGEISGCVSQSNSYV